MEMGTGAGETTSGSPSHVLLSADHAIELGELLRFLCDLFAEAPDPLADALSGFCGDAYLYLIEELREDLARFALLVVSAPGRSFLGDVR
jgi:hypothetical protein